MNNKSYEDWSYPLILMCEDYKGTDIVRWYGTIESQIVKMLESSDSKKNRVYSDKISEFLKIWRSNPITGSINTEIVRPLATAASLLAVDSWDHATYFRSLRDSLNILIASEEQLPRGVDTEANEKMRGIGAGISSGVSNPEYGPEDDIGTSVENDNPDETADVPNEDDLKSELKQFEL